MHNCSHILIAVLKIVHVLAHDNDGAFQSHVSIFFHNSKDSISRIIINLY